MQYTIEAVDNSTKELMLDFLRKHENTSLFLLNNFETYGLKVSRALYSGNFKLIRSKDQIVGVFCLTKKGNLLIESEIHEPIYDLVLSSCQEESSPLTGLMGSWDFCDPFWTFLKNRSLIKEEIFNYKGLLYSSDLTHSTFENHPNVRLLNNDDFEDWKRLKIDYLKEEGLPNTLTDSQLKTQYLEKTDKKISWGYFLKFNSLISIAELNAKALDLGQLGGVYTIPSFRRQGYSKTLLKHLIHDIKTNHSIRKLIIFTGTDNMPAQNLYNSLGVRQVGYYAMFFSKETL